LLTVTTERETGGEGLAVELTERVGLIHADLSIGANVAAAKALRANGGISSPGFKLHGAGFIVTPAEVACLEADAPIKPYRNGRDLTDRPRGVMLIDLFGLTADEVRSRYPAVFQRVLARVKPERDAKGHTKDGAGYAKLWWLFGKPRQELRKQLEGLPRYIATVETAKHRLFQFLDASISPDNMLVCIALDDAYTLGVLSSRVHVVWALATGGRLGVGNDPRYNKSRCFETFPFPDIPSPQPSPACGGGSHASRIAELAEQLDALRKRVLAEHPDLTLTGLYNVLEKIRTMEPSPRRSPGSCGDGLDSGLRRNDEVGLTAKEKDIHQRGLVGVLQSLHAELDAEVLAAYGWSDLLPSPAGGGGAGGEGDFAETLLTRLVELNTRRSSEEAAGNVRWLRPDYQNPVDRHRASPDFSREGGNPVDQSDLGLSPDVSDELDSSVRGKDSVAKTPWPATLPEQVAAVARVLAASSIPLSEAAIAARFSGKGTWKKRLPPLLETLVALGRARVVEGAYVSE
jgi:hypothetical protein